MVGTAYAAAVGTLLIALATSTWVVVMMAVLALAFISFAWATTAIALRVHARALRRQELEAREELSPKRRARLQQF
jgi:hypothetical protein